MQPQSLARRPSYNVAFAMLQAQSLGSVYRVFEV